MANKGVETMEHKAWDVKRKGKWINTVFFNSHCEGGAPITAEDVKQSLVEHDGYPADITVTA